MVIKSKKSRKISAPATFPNRFSHLIYSNAQHIKNGSWSIIYFSEIDKSYKNLARRIVDNELWLNDTRIRTATESDKKLFDMMEVKSKEEVITEAEVLAEIPLH